MASGLCLLIVVFGIAGCVPGYFDDTFAEIDDDAAGKRKDGAAATGLWAAPVAAVALLGGGVGGRRRVRFAVAVWER